LVSFVCLFLHTASCYRHFSDEQLDDFFNDLESDLHHDRQRHFRDNDNDEMENEDEVRNSLDDDDDDDDSEDEDDYYDRDNGDEDFYDGDKSKEKRRREEEEEEDRIKMGEKDEEEKEEVKKPIIQKDVEEKKEAIHITTAHPTTLAPTARPTTVGKKPTSGTVKPLLRRNYRRFRFRYRTLHRGVRTRLPRFRTRVLRLRRFRGCKIHCYYVRSRYYGRRRKCVCRKY